MSMARYSSIAVDAQLLGQGEGLAVGDRSLHGFWGPVLRRDVAEEAQGVGFVTPFLVGPSEF
jgi:hypothetical protein